jgi:hypothetical protein
MSPPARPQSLAQLEKLVAALKAKGIVTEEELSARQAQTDRASPEVGARMVARAWTDPAYRALLLSDGSRAAEMMGVSMAGAPPLGVLEDTAKRHHVIVCTLCSCYPRFLLGAAPDWYKARAYRSRAVREPRAVLREFGLDLPDSVRVEVHDSTAELRYMVLPVRPTGTEAWDEERLAALVTRDCMIGVAVPEAH